MSEIYVVPPNDKSIGAYSTARAKIANNPIGAIIGGVAGWYILKNRTNIENIWAKTGIILLSVVVGAYATSSIKRGINNLKK